jgi:hypothetical protein
MTKHVLTETNKRASHIPRSSFATPVSPGTGANASTSMPIISAVQVTLLAMSMIGETAWATCQAFKSDQAEKINRILTSQVC